MNDNIEKFKSNVKIYKNYKMFAYDWLFYYAISMLYFTTVKNFSMSQVMYLTSIYAFTNLVCQIPINIVIEKLGLRKSIIIGNILNLFVIFGYIFFKSFYMFAIMKAICAIGFALKNIAEADLIYSSLKQVGKRDSFSKVEGAANSKYYYLEAIASILAGYMFLINGYLPLIWCFASWIVALCISLEFYDVERETKEDNHIKSYFKEFKIIFKSCRIILLLFFALIFTGTISMSTNLYQAILIDFKFDAKKLAFVVCLLKALTGIGAKTVYYIEKFTKNRTLTIFSIMYVLSLLFIGIQGIEQFSSRYSIYIIYISLILMGIINGGYRVIQKKYVVSFTHSNLRSKVITLYYIFENAGATILCFIAGILLERFSNGISTAIMTFISLTLLLIVLNIMKNKVGLKPNEYSRSDLYETEIEPNKIEGKI